MILDEKIINNIIEKYYENIIFFLYKTINDMLECITKQNKYNIYYKTINDVLNYQLNMKIYSMLIKLKISWVIFEEIDSFTLEQREYILEKIFEKIKKEKINELIILYKLGGGNNVRY